MNPHQFSATAALKEWSLVCEALAQGRQAFILRKGGLLDEDGTFHLEHREFLFLPTWLHQERGLVRPEHQDLFDSVPLQPDGGPKLAYFRHFAKVERVWSLGEDQDAKLQNLQHIWSRQYLDLRFGYKPDKPLLCAAIRLFELESPIRYELRPQDTGCRSWVEWSEPKTFFANPTLPEQEFTEAVKALDTSLTEVK